MSHDTHFRRGQRCPRCRHLHAQPVMRCERCRRLMTHPGIWGRCQDCGGKMVRDVYDTGRRRCLKCQRNTAPATTLLEFDAAPYVLRLEALECAVAELRANLRPL
jgi:hypothetical protein